MQDSNRGQYESGEDDPWFTLPVAFGIINKY